MGANLRGGEKCTAHTALQGNRFAALFANQFHAAIRKFLRNRVSESFGSFIHNS